MGSLLGWGCSTTLARCTLWPGCSRCLTHTLHLSCNAGAHLHTLEGWLLRLCKGWHWGVHHLPVQAWVATWGRAWSTTKFSNQKHIGLDQWHDLGRQAEQSLQLMLLFWVPNQQANAHHLVIHFPPGCCLCFGWLRDGLGQEQLSAHSYQQWGGRKALGTCSFCEDTLRVRAVCCNGKSAWNQPRAMKLCQSCSQMPSAANLLRHWSLWPFSSQSSPATLAFLYLNMHFINIWLFWF